MKKLLIVLTIVLFLVGCGETYDGTISNREVATIDNVEIKVTEVNDNIIQYTIDNKSDEQIKVSPAYYIEKEHKRKYYRPTVEVSFLGFEQVVDADSSITRTADVSAYYKDYEKGKYRLIVEVNDSLIATDFEVE